MPPLRWRMECLDKELTMNKLVELGTASLETKAAVRGFLLDSQIVESPPASGLCYIGKVFNSAGTEDPTDCP